MKRVVLAIVVAVVAAIAVAAPALVDEASVTLAYVAGGGSTDP